MKKKKMFELIIVLVGVGMIAFLIGTTQNAYAHDPSATPVPDKSHIHIKGRITTPEGAPVANVVLIGFSSVATSIGGPAVQNLPTECNGGIYPAAGIAKTASDGSYEILQFIKSDTPACRDAFDRVTIQKSNIIWRKDGYDIRPR